MTKQVWQSPNINETNWNANTLSEGIPTSPTNTKCTCLSSSLLLRPMEAQRLACSDACTRLKVWKGRPEVQQESVSSKSFWKKGKTRVFSNATDWGTTKMHKVQWSTCFFSIRIEDFEKRTSFVFRQKTNQKYKVFVACLTSFLYETPQEMFGICSLCIQYIGKRMVFVVTA